MCGITGFIDHNQKINESNFKQGCSSIKHRGGNGNGYFFEKTDNFMLGLGNERLSTIDLSTKAQQPLISTCGNYIITFNGLIANYLQIRETLIKYGVIFSTLSDTEVILESYKKWGTKAFEKLDGSYCFAIFDRKQKQLIIARDELGTKPLYFYKQKGTYAFASEISALLELSLTAKEINQTALRNYFRYGYFLGEQTIFQNIFKFKKGTITIIDIHSGNNYDMPIIRPQVSANSFQKQNEEEILKKIEELLTESILKRNVADVAVGTLLSGGYDSATVAAILQKNQSKRIKTFTVGFKNKKIDEAPRAREIAAHLKTNHEEFYLDDQDVLEIVKNLPEIFDEPIGDSSAIPLAFIAKKVNQDIKVLLCAEGGDELFGGYRTYVKAIKRKQFEENKLPEVVKKAVNAFLQLVDPQMSEIMAQEDLLHKYLSISACFTLKDLDLLLNHRTEIDNTPNKKALNIKDLLIYDLHNYLPNNILFKNDRCFAHYGMDIRDAILNSELVDYLSTLDPEWFIKDGEQKYLLKKITHQYIPENLMQKPTKGFEVPLASWLKTTLKPLVNKYLAPEMLNKHQLLSIEEVHRLRNAFIRNPNSYNAQRIWLLLQFQMWYERWMD